MASVPSSSVRQIREFREMLITDINVRTHPITDTDIRYEGYSVAVGLLLMPYSLPPPTAPILRNWLVALACGLPAFTCRLNSRQYTLLQSTDQKREAGWGDTVRKLSVKLWSQPPNKHQEWSRRGQGGMGVRRRLSEFDILINTARPTGHVSLGTPFSHAAATPASQRVCSLIAMAEYLMTGD